MPYNGLYSSFLNLQRTTQLRGGCVFCLLDAGPWGGQQLTLVRRRFPFLSPEIGQLIATRYLVSIASPGLQRQTE
jgi:hypothetical protein